ncbi:MAG: DUF6997 domain-containing protein [Halanaeroarchaeum sp.]
MVFEPALEELAAAERAVYGPTSFRAYVDRHGVDAGPRTPRYISVDSLDDLAPELRDAGVMVLRAGSAPDGRGTAFVLVDAPGGAEAFFLRDGAIFGDQPVTGLTSPVDRERLLSFDLLPSLSETSLVNLGLASGVLAEALDLDTAGALAPPATGRSTFTFDVRPHGGLSETIVHRTGQVEIDTLFAERRDGERVLFVVEAKVGAYDSLAKHKLVYPLLAVAEDIDPSIDLVPVYLRCRQSGDRITVSVAECSFPDPREQVAGVDELVVERSRVVELELGE